MPATIALKYCGHCQPHRMMPELMEKVQQRLPETRFIPWNGEATARLLLLNACPALCLRKDAVTMSNGDFTADITVVGNDSLDYEIFSDEEALVAALLERLRAVDTT